MTSREASGLSRQGRSPPPGASVSDIALGRSQQEEARRRYEEALPLYEQVGDVGGRPDCSSTRHPYLSIEVCPHCKVRLS